MGYKVSFQLYALKKKRIHFSTIFLRNFDSIQGFPEIFAT